MAQLSRKQQLIFLIFNLLYFGLGAVMLGVGIYNIVALFGFRPFIETYYIAGGVIFVIVGVLKIVLSLLGILGMFMQWRILITIYVLSSVFLILPTLAAGVYGLQQYNFVFDRLDSDFTSPDNSTLQLRQSIETNFFCCNGDMNSPSCIRARNYRLNQRTDVSTQIGCQYYVTESIQSLFNSIGGIGLGFGFFEATAAVVAMQHMEGVI